MSFSFSLVVIATLLLLVLAIYLGIVLPYRRSRDAMVEELQGVQEAFVDDVVLEEEARFVNMVVAYVLYCDLHGPDIHPRKKTTRAAFFVTNNWLMMTGRPAPHVTGLHRRIREELKNFRQFSKTDSADIVDE